MESDDPSTTWVVYSGESLRSEAEKPLTVTFDAPAIEALNRGDRYAWYFFILSVQYANGDYQP